MRATDAMCISITKSVAQGREVSHDFGCLGEREGGSGGGGRQKRGVKNVVRRVGVLPLILPTTNACC